MNMMNTDGAPAGSSQNGSQDSGRNSNLTAGNGRPNAIIRTLAPPATQMLRADHMHVTALFHKIQPDTSDSVRAATVRNICTALEIHAQLEEELFYPALREGGVKSHQLDESMPQHDEMRQLIQRVRSCEGPRSTQDEALNELMNCVMHHMADEETQLLPEAERMLGPQRLSDLGARMTSRRIALTKPRAAELAADMARAAPAKTALVAASAVGALVACTLLVASMRRAESYQPRRGALFR